MKIIAHFWRSLLFIGSLVGLIFLAQDFSDLPQALSGWQRVLAMISLTTALGVFSVIALIYIIWIDARPFFEKWRKGNAREYSVNPEIVWKSSLLAQEEGGRKFFVNRAYLHVYNNGRSGRTALNVRAKLHCWGEKSLLIEDSEQQAADIQHGGQTHFYLGKMVSYVFLGNGSLDIVADENDIIEASHNLRIGHASLRISDTTRIGQAQTGRPYDNLHVVVMSDNLPSTRLSLEFEGSQAVLSPPPIELSTYPTAPSPIKITNIKQS
jgi:hypothetical protein